jgi:hypothetical protein
MRLRDVQAQFYDLVTAPEGVAKALADRGLSVADLDQTIVGDARLGAVDRLDVYANMYFFRLRDVLADDYSKVAAALGESAFHNLVTDYLLACRPAHPSINRAGNRLPGFLGDHPLSRERPWLPALALLERTHNELFDGPDAETLSLDDVQAMAPPELMALRLQPIPCHRVVAHGYALDDLWFALEDSAPDTVAATPETLLVWRPELDVLHRVLPEDEAQLLARLDGETSLQSLCEHVPAPSVEEAAQQLFNVVGRWLSEGLLMRADRSA